ncbi:MAG: MMPL family transporter [Clostridia bacterium]|nr:MMPL family transporter [Clostridia bacterium]
MQKIGEFVVKHRKIILIISIILLIPSIIGYKATRINYDILTYLPGDIKTIQGQNILSEDFDMGAYSIVVLKNMPAKDILKLENKIKKEIDNVQLCASIADVTGEEFPIEMLPDEVTNRVYKNEETLLLVTFTDAISSDETMLSIQKLRDITDERCMISGMSATLLDTRNLSESEITIYVVIAVILCLLILTLSLDSFVAPVLLLLNIGFAILYNMGTNIFLGEISYITKAISAVLQLGVTMDFAIFLYHSFISEKEQCADTNKAMATAIGKTLVSVLGSSLTTFAGFIALCSMDLTLGKDIGIVMAKGIVFGLICVVTVLPSLILACNNLIEKTKHKVLMPKFTRLSNFIIKHHIIFVLLFIVVLPFAFYGYKNTEVYYKLDASLPEDLPSVSANTEVKDTFKIVSPELLLVNSNLSNDEINKMISEIETVDGIDWVLGMSKLENAGVPDEMIPSEVTSKVQNDKYKVIVINSLYEMATPEINEQIKAINNIIQKYDQNAILAGEGPLMNDLVTVSDHDFNSVNIVSIVVIFILMFFVLKSISLPVILIAVIEFAIFINMGIPYYTKTVLPFVSSIVIGTIQLGATIDYAILITTKYIEKRKEGITKKEAVQYALTTSISSIFVSGLCFFAATFGVGVYSKIEMISSLCTLMARGAIVSMFIVVLILPAFLMLLDKIVCKTTIGMKRCK